jgi:hypothetical protein
MRGFWRSAIPLVAAIFAGALLVQADEPVAGGAIVVDADGREHTLTQVKFGAGTKRLAWLADPNGTTDDAKKGPLALEFREPNSTTLLKGVVTLVPVASIESVEFDQAKQEVTLSVKGLQQRLVGILFDRRVNGLGVSGQEDGKAATYRGGAIGKSSVKSMSFGGAQSPPKLKRQTTWNVQIVQPKANNPTVVVRNLKVLIGRSAGAEKLVDGLPVRKGEPINFDTKLKRLEILAHDQVTDVVAAEVEAGGPERTIIIPHILEQDGKPGTVVGLLGEVDAGWKLFPLHTIKLITPSKRKIE